MICTELYNGQGLGNQLWTYTVARIIADKQKTSFAIIGKENFKGKKFMSLDFGFPLKSKLHEGPNPELPERIKYYYLERSEYLKGTPIDISRTDENLLSILPYTKFDGNCQSTKYLEGYKEKIQEWVVVDTKSALKLDENSCVIHIRFGDFSGMRDVFLQKKYYLHAMTYIKSHAPNITFYCISDEPEKAKKFLPEAVVIEPLNNIEDSEKAAHHKGGPVARDFATLMTSPYLIIPNSSFSWWAAYLNKNAKIVIAPKYWARHNVSNGYWSTSDCITEGFIYIDREGNPFSASDCWFEKNKYELSNNDIFSPTPKQPSIIKHILDKIKKICSFLK